MGETKKLFSSSAVMFVGTFIASIFSYLFNMLMGRYLGPKNYGEMTALMSLLMIVSVAGGAILTVAMKYGSELYVGERLRALKKLLAVLSKYVYFFALFLFLIGLALVRPISNYFSISGLTPTVVALLSLIFGLVIMVNKGILQGAQKFYALSAVGIFEMAARLALGIILVKIGLAVSGALLGIVLATAATYALTFWPISGIFKKIKKDRTEKNFTFDKKEILNYSWPALGSMLLLAIAINLDIILVKHYFPPDIAGIYAAVSTVGKIILYITSPVVSVMFPMISEKKTRGDKHYPLFFYSLLMVLVGSFLILGAYTVAPAKIIGVLYGAQYINLFYLLPEIGLAILLYSLINLLVNYFLVVRNFRFIWFFALAEILQILAIAKFHSSLELVVRIIILSFALLFAAMMIYYLFGKRQQLKSFFRRETF
ncbi:MAG: oligosaccharide flippase family protein [Candidatus Berkelbacteria bacterium]|nr:oligosaccharide flippase family protein [Candidatus Berkelbacteria bacterium]